MLTVSVVFVGRPYAVYVIRGFQLVVAWCAGVWFVENALLSYSLQSESVGNATISYLTIRLTLSIEGFSEDLLGSGRRRTHLSFGKICMDEVVLSVINNQPRRVRPGLKSM